eukprot:TRINITY_DN10174_c0_g1_i1.p1 TRINITY_DN10174_c0_g1~~TRINITY_DN10174_c0_g1_i1.p1  ORF type:complete len:337 (-),score=157.76 TRINITY_DN10174_c0_g1_i1:220-1230(-)
MVLNIGEELKELVSKEEWKKLEGMTLEEWIGNVELVNNNNNNSNKMGIMNNNNNNNVLKQEWMEKIMERLICKHAVKFKEGNEWARQSFFISTSNKELDLMLNGGIKGSSLNEIFGSKATGKTQCCFSVCSSFLLSNQLDNAVWIDNSSSFNVSRLAQIMHNVNQKKEIQSIQNSLSRLSIFNVFDPFSLVQVLNEIGNQLESQKRERISGKDLKGRTKLIIIDSLGGILFSAIGMFSTSKSKEQTFSEFGQSIIFQIARLIKQIAIQYNVAFLWTNYETRGLKNEYSRAGLGESWSSIPDAQIQLSKSLDSNSVIAEVHSSKIEFTIHEGGIKDH